MSAVTTAIKENTIMKKTALIFALAVCLAFAVFTAIACEQTPPPATEKHTVTFKLGDETIATKTVEDNGVVSALPEIAENKIPQGKVFDGWYLGETEFTAKTKVTNDVTVTAKLSDKQSEETYTVTFVVNGETYETVSGKQLNSQINLFSYSTYDYEIAEWTDENNVKYAFNDVYTVKGNATLTAVNPKPMQFTMKKAADGDYYAVAGLFDTSSDELTVPETYLGLPVKEIDAKAFSGKNNTLKKLTVNGNVEKIGRQAFAGLFALKELTVPFLGEERYSAVNGHGEKGLLAYWFAADEPMSSSFRDYYLWSACFSQDEQNPATAMEAFVPISFEKITVNGGVISDYAFNNVKTLKSINFGDEVTEIGSNVFTIYPNYAEVGESKLEEVICTQNSKITSIGQEIISYQPNLSKFCIPPKVKVIHPYLFYYLDSLQELVLFSNSELQEIGQQSFFGTSITELDLPATVKTLGALAFGNCTSLETASIPASAVNLAAAVFDGCTSLYSVTFGLGSPITEIPAKFFEGCLNLRNVNVPAGVVKFADEAFANCQSLNIDVSKLTYIGNGALRATDVTDVNINADIEYIGHSAFASCDELETVTFANGTSKLSAILSNTFDGCAKLSAIEIPDCITSIGVRAFSYTGLVNVKLPANLQTIDELAFFQFNEERSLLTTITDLGTLSKLTEIGDSAFAGNAKLVITSLPASLQTIGRQAFQHTKMQGKITIDPTVTTSVGESAFSDCPEATIEIIGTTDDIPRKWNAAWTGLGDNAVAVVYTNESTDYVNLFDGFTGYVADETYYVTGYNGTETALILVSEHDGKPVVYRRGVFSGNGKITSVTLADNITAIPKEFFSNCENLTEVIIPENVKITSIGDYAFNMCRSLVSLTISDASELTSIGDYAFYNDYKLKFVDMPGNCKIEYIGDYAFHTRLPTANSSLVRADINLSNVTYIGRNAFYGNNSLNANYVLPSSLKALGEAAFGGCQKLSLTLSDGFKLARYENSVFANVSGLIWQNLNASTVFTDAEYIGDSAFVGTRAFVGQKVVIPNTVKYLGNSALAVSGAASVVIDCNAELIIGDYAFDACQQGFWLLIKGIPAKIGTDVCGSIKNAHIYFTETLTVVKEPASWNPNYLRVVAYKLGESECKISLYFNEYDSDNMNRTAVPCFGKGEWSADENGDPIHPDDGHEESGIKTE